MSLSIENHVFKDMKKAHCSLFFIDDFVSLRSAITAIKALERLADKGEWCRLVLRYFTRNLKLGHLLRDRN